MNEPRPVVIKATITLEMADGTIEEIQLNRPYRCAIAVNRKPSDDEQFGIDVTRLHVDSEPFLVSLSAETGLSDRPDEPPLTVKRLDRVNRA